MGASRRNHVFDRVNALEDTGVIDAVSVNDWADAIDRTESVDSSVRQNRRIESVLEAFENWADRADRTLEPCFRTRRVESAITGDASVVCRPPTVALAEYRNGDLVHVAPSQVDGQMIAVEDRLEALTRGEIEVERNVAGDKSGPLDGEHTDANRDQSRLEGTQTGPL